MARKKSIGATLVLNNGNFFTNARKAAQEVTGLKGKLQSLIGQNDKISKSNTNLGNSFGSVAKKIAGVAAAAVSLNSVKNFAKQCVDVANEATLAHTRLNTIMKQIPKNTQEMTDSVENYAYKLSKSTSIGATAQKYGASQLASFQMSAKSIKLLMPELNNLAVGQYGVSVSGDQMIQAANMIGKAYSGQTGAMTRAGVVMSEEQKKIIQTGNETQKTATIVKVLQQNFGNLAEEMARTPAGAMQRLKNQINGIKRTIGDALEPVVVSVINFAADKIPFVGDIIIDLIAKIEDLYTQCRPYLERLKNTFLDIGKQIKVVYDVCRPSIENLKNAFFDAGVRIKEAFGNINTGDFGAAIQNVLPDVINFAAKVIEYFGKIGAFAIDKVTSTVDKIKPIVANLWTAIKSGAEMAGNAILWLKDNWGSLSPIIYGVIGAIAAYNVITEIKNGLEFVGAAATYALKTAQETLNTVFVASPIGWIALGIGAAIAAVVILYKKCETFRTFVNQLFDKIVSGGKSAADGLKKAWHSMVNALKPIVASIANAFVQAWELIKVVWDKVKPFFSGIWEHLKINAEYTKTVLSGAFQMAWAKIQLIWTAASGFFMAVWNSIAGIFSVVKDVLTGNWQGAWDGIKGIVGTWKDYFANVWESIKNVFSKTVDFFKDIFGGAGKAIKEHITTALNEAIKLMNKIPGVNIPTISSAGNDVPGLATGGIINRSGTVLVGERGPEFLNLPQGARVTPLERAANNNNINIYVYGSGNVDDTVNQVAMKLKLALANL